MRAELERTDDATDADGGIDVAEPQLQLLFLLGDERTLQLVGERSRGLVASDHGIVGSGDHTAKVAEIQFHEVVLGRIGPVEPLGNAQLGEQLLSHRQQAGCRNLFLAFGLETSVLLVDGLTNRWDAALQCTFGDRALCLGELGEHCVAVSSSRLETLGLGTLRQLWRRGEVGATTTIVAAWPAAGGIAAGPVAAGSVAAGAVAAWASGTIAVWAVATRAVAAIATIAAVRPLRPSQLLGDCLERRSGGNELE